MVSVREYMVVACSLLLIAGCRDKSKSDFDRTSLLTNIGNNVIVPSYLKFSDAALELKQKGDAFTAAPSVATLDSLKLAFVEAYTAFQAVEVYDFSASQDMRNMLNSFPVDTVQVNANVVSGSYNLNAVNNLKAKGFPALDFLLYSQSGQDVVNLFSIDADAAKRKQYLTDVIAEIQQRSATAYAEWSGNYLQTFIAASGTDVGSSVGMLVNDISFETERNRRERVGNALGYVGIINSGTVVPYSVEGFFSNKSNALLIENLQRSKALYTGSSGTGFDDYLDFVNATYDGSPLSSAISNQFDVTIQAAQNVPVGFSQAVNSNKQQMETLFLELKKLTVMLKVDMSSQLGVVINYSDNDGD